MHPAAPELAFDPTKAVQDGRWICGAGDSTKCTNLTPTHSPDPNVNDTNYDDYTGFNGGSNAGPCVTLFAPAKNIAVASVGAAADYRDPRVNESMASGTSFSAPIVAGFAARILQANPTLKPPDIRAVLESNTVATLDPDTLHTRDHLGALITGAPNKLLRLGDVNITAHPASVGGDGPQVLQVAASGTSSVTYQWYEVNADFDYAKYRRGAHHTLSSSLIAGATASSFTAPASSTRRAYWVRVTNGCGTADSDIAVVVPTPSAPANLTATVNGTSVNLTWSAAAGAEQYLVQRKTAGTPWTTVGQVSGHAFADTPSAPGGMVVYRVVAAAGAAYLPPGSLARSSSSNRDFANLNALSYESLATAEPFTLIRAQHIIELRQAVNALAQAVDATIVYAPAEVALAALQGAIIRSTDVTSLLGKINTIRAHPELEMTPVALSEPVTTGAVIKREDLLAVREAVQ
ncbi:MAG TPA: S8 family serine peptidase [Thermoanaerobaculia bacterium]|jgi:hypothetical protein